MKRTVIKIENGVARHPDYRFRQPVNLLIEEGESVAIVGPNGGGKSMLVDLIVGRHVLMRDEVQYDFGAEETRLVCDCIRHITFRDVYGTGESGAYYQQRWNQWDQEESPVVRTLFAKEGEDLPEGLLPLLRLFHLEDVLEKRVILLSSGELRKMQLIRVLVTRPRVLILDNPFIGLDVEARGQLNDLLVELTRTAGLTLILVLSKTDDIPDCVEQVVEVRDMTVGRKMPLREWVASLQVSLNGAGGCAAETGMRMGTVRVLDEASWAMVQRFSAEDHAVLENPIIDFRHVHIQYGERTILRDLNWTVHKGEHWALSGENGSGKSTLLSLVCADNPQSYANDIRLFGHKRGSGESIWDIKRHIGYISPEMHRSYCKDLPGIDVVASGLSDGRGLYHHPTEVERGVCMDWMRVFGVADKANVSFLRLSSGEQRLLLVARAFVKSPALLILDEPLHGLDLRNRRMVKDVIEAFCGLPNKTLIMVTHYAEDLPVCIDHHIWLEKVKS